MKSTNLEILKSLGLRVPNFIVVERKELVDFAKLDSNLFAVRSNCDVEDSEGKAYAGYFDTLLRVGKEDLENAISTVLASYGKVKDYTGSKTVIIQDMIEADLSGVVFTSNPNGLLSEIVINYSEGAGAVVDGTADSYTYYYNKSDKSILKSSKAGLTNAVVDQIVEAALTIEKKFERPMDIEFAVKADEVYILQARPITTLDLSHKIILDNSNIVESYPGVSLPLTGDFAKEVYYKIFKSMLLKLTEDKALVSNMDENLRHMVEVYNGSLYYNITNWYNIINLLPMSHKLIGVWQNMLGVEDRTVSLDDIHIPGKTKRRIVRNFVKYMKIIPKEMDDLNVWFANQIVSYRERLDNTASVEALVALYDTLMTELTDRWYITLMNDMYTFIYTALAGKKNKEYISNIKGLESKKPLMALNDLYKIYSEEGATSDKYKVARSEFVNSFGDRCVAELKLETKTYRTNPELLDKLLADFEFTSFDTGNMKEVNSLTVRRAKNGIYNREISRLNRSRIFGIARDIMLKIGKLYEEASIIDEYTDVFYLTMDELKHAGEGLQAKVSERKREYAFYEGLAVANRAIFSGKITNKLPIDYEEVFTNLSGDILVGNPVSFGVVEGKALVVDNPLEADIDSNTIIITKTTDPGWVFIIEQCAGIVAEQGSLLSHTAIISREMGKPAIVGIKNATKIIKTGDIVKIDADKGIVTIK